MNVWDAITVRVIRDFAERPLFGSILGRNSGDRPLIYRRRLAPAAVGVRPSSH